ncbi:MAG: RluA family pseudouridine synthase [Lachnospiraceae bacterium]|nr:RluA family pseudouridine synthase [Lachnospiraceae bacterium]
MGQTSMNIIYEDKDILAVHKPAGLATQSAGIGQKDLVSEALTYIKRSGVKKPYIGVIGRLDQPVEGIVLMAKTPEAAGVLSKALKENRIEKYYEARVIGVPDEASGRFTDHMKKAVKGNLSQVCDSSDPEAKEAVLEYEVTASSEIATGEEVIKTSLLRIHLITGRHHQIRLQLAARGFPIIGDRKYGSEKAVAVADKLGERNVALKCVSLSFPHPSTGKEIRLEA